MRIHMMKPAREFLQNQPGAQGEESSWKEIRVVSQGANGEKGEAHGGEAQRQMYALKGAQHVGLPHAVGAIGMLQAFEGLQ